MGHPFTLPFMLLAQVVLTGKAVEEDGLTLDDYVFPDWAMAIAWMIVAFPLVVIVVYYLGKYLYDGGWEVRKFHTYIDNLGIVYYTQI